MDICINIKSQEGFYKGKCDFREVLFWWGFFEEVNRISVMNNNSFCTSNSSPTAKSIATF